MLPSLVSETLTSRKGTLVRECEPVNGVETIDENVYVLGTFSRDHKKCHRCIATKYGVEMERSLKRLLDYIYHLISNARSWNNC